MERFIILCQIVSFLYPDELVRLRRLCHRAVDFVDNLSRSSHVVITTRNNAGRWLKLTQWPSLTCWLERSAIVVEVLELNGSEHECEGLWFALKVMCAKGMRRLRKLKLRFDLSKVQGCQSIECKLPRLQYLELNNAKEPCTDGGLVTLKIDGPKLETIKLSLGEMHYLYTQLLDEVRDQLMIQRDSGMWRATFLVNRAFSNGFIPLSMSEIFGDILVNLEKEGIKKRDFVPPSWPDQTDLNLVLRNWSSVAKTRKQLQHYVLEYSKILWKKYSPSVIEALIDHVDTLGVSIPRHPRCPPEPWLKYATTADLSRMPPWLKRLPVATGLPTLSPRRCVRWTSHNSGGRLNVRNEHIQLFVGVISSAPTRRDLWPDFAAMSNLEVIEMSSKGWHLLANCLNAPVAWPKGCRVTLAGLASNFPANLASAIEFLKCIKCCRVNHLVLMDDFTECWTIFWIYWVAHAALVQDNLTVRMTLHTVKFFPSIWRRMILELASGEYLSETFVSVLKHLGVPTHSCADLIGCPDTLSQRWQSLDAALTASHVQARDVGTISEGHKTDFERWYRDLVNRTLPDHLGDRTFGECASVNEIGNLPLTSSWYLKRLFSGDMEQFTSWGIPVMLPTVLPKAWITDSLS